MPHLNVSLSTVVTPEIADKVASLLTELTATILGKKRELTAVAIVHTPPRHWYIGAAPLSDQQRPSFYLEVKVTEGTNTKNEKASYIDQVFAAMAGILGPLATASYIVIDEVRADAWGYAGQTQEYRYIKEKPVQV